MICFNESRLTNKASLIFHACTTYSTESQFHRYLLPVEVEVPDIPGSTGCPACGRRQLADDIFGCGEIALSEDLFGKLPKRTGWQPVLPGICSRSHDHMIVFELFRFEVPERFRARFGSARILPAVFGILPNMARCLICGRIATFT